MCAVSKFLLLGTVLLWTFLNLPSSIHVQVLLLDVSGNEIVNIRHCKEFPNYLPEWLCQFAFSPAKYETFCWSSASSHLSIISKGFHFYTLKGYKIVSHCSFDDSEDMNCPQPWACLVLWSQAYSSSPPPAHVSLTVPVIEDTWGPMTTLNIVMTSSSFWDPAF